MQLNPDEIEMVRWYRSLTRLEQLAVNCWLTTGDTQLLMILRERSERLQRFYYFSATHRRDEATLHRR